MWRTSLLLGAAFGLCAQEASAEFWVPDPRTWRLELSPELGGWWGGSPEDLRVKLVAPGDPRPRRAPTEEWWEFWQADWKRRRAALLEKALELMKADPEASPRAEVLLRESFTDTPGDPRVGQDYAAWACALRARKRAEAELERARAGRQILVEAWHNGQKLSLRTEPNRDHYLGLEPLRGENRLELREPRSGQVLVRSWWQGSGGPRLSVHLQGEGPGWDIGDLQLLEPNGRLSRPDTVLKRSNPAAGTYSLRWLRRSYERGWWDEEPYLGNAPIRIRALVVLDAGTDRERRWNFEALGLPGAPPMTLGSFDVETD